MTGRLAAAALATLAFALAGSVAGTAQQPPAGPPSPAGSPPPTTSPTTSPTPPAATPSPTPPAAPFAALPQERHGHCIEVLPGGLLCFGGFDHGDRTDDRGMRQTWWLPAGADAWRRRADLRRAQAFAGSACIDGIVYSVGDGADRYDAIHDRWVEVVAPGKLPTSHFACATHERRIYVLGGATAVGTGFAAVDPQAGKLEELPPPPDFRRGDHFHFLVSLADGLHALGGLDAATFRPRRSHWLWRDGAWHAQPPLPVGMWRKFAASAVVDGRWFVSGEFGTYGFEPKQGTWSARAERPVMLAMPATVARGDQLWVFGGMLPDGDASPLLAYDCGADRWWRADRR